MLDQQQLGTVPVLVIYDEDFQLGVKLGRQACEDECEECPMVTDGDVMQLMGECLSHEHHERDTYLNRRLGLPVVSCSYHVGFVVGWIAQLMATEPTYLPTVSVAAPLDARRSTPDAQGMSLACQMPDATCRRAKWYGRAL